MRKHPKRPRRAQPARRPAAPQRPAALAFTPVPVRARHDGWTPAKQVAFLHALATSGCVDEACRAVGMSTRSAYTLRARPDAASFRQAWEVTLDYALDVLADTMIGRAINGVATPIFFQGEQVGEKRRYDERLAMFLLRTRRPERYGPGRDRMLMMRNDPDGAAALMNEAIGRTAADGLADLAGEPRTPRPPLRTEALADDPEIVEAQRVAEEARTKAAEETRWQATLQRCAETPHGAAAAYDLEEAEDDGDIGADYGGDVSRTS